MNHRDRLLAAINHEEPDRVPLDFGDLCACHIVAYRKLVEYLGVREQVLLMDEGEQAARPSEVILKRFDIDTRQVYSNLSLFPIRTPTEGVTMDSWGIKRKFIGYYWEVTSDGHPLRNMETVDEIREWSWPEPEEAFGSADLNELEKTAKNIRDNTDYAVVFPYVAGLSFTRSQLLRGFGTFLTDLKMNPKIAVEIIDRVSDITAKVFERVIGAVGEYVDVVTTGDDLGMQDAPMVSLDMYRKYVKPYQKRIIDAIKSKTDAKILCHADGSIAYYLDDLAEIGVDIINPVQVSAAGMDTKMLKQRFGDKLCFWGAIDTQRVLPFGNPDDVREEVKHRIRDLAPGGGYVLCAVHNIQPEVPPENIVTMYDEALKFHW